MPKAAQARGTRDFLPDDVRKRDYLFGIISDVFRSYGYEEIQTPALEKLETLTGKYGEEGDRLIFKILNSGDFFADIPKSELEKVYLYKSSNLIPLLSNKALRYDLTVPLARFVTQHQNELSFPFKRFQIQPVWRADRPQKGRFREFYQCDADIVGSKSLYYEAELLAIYDEVFWSLGLENYVIRLNHRRFLIQMFESVLDDGEDTIPFIMLLDKLDKIGMAKLEELMLAQGMTKPAFERISKLFESDSNEKQLELMEAFLRESGENISALNEIEQVLHLLPEKTRERASVRLDPSLARGLDYYTGCIFEVEVPESGFGSLGGGGRYDKLTEIFGLKDMTGVGISFGAERILQFLEENKLIPDSRVKGHLHLVCCLDERYFGYAHQIASTLRASGLKMELYPEVAKMKKQLKYAHSKRVDHCLLIGQDEYESGLITVKHMATGEQQRIKSEDLGAYLLEYEHASSRT